MRVIDRFDMYMKHKDLNDNQVTVQLGLSTGLIGKARKQGADLGKKSIELILSFYTDINRVWLLTGEGDMLTDNKLKEPEGKHKKEYDSDSYMDKDETIELLHKTIGSLNKVIESQQQTIESQQRTIESLEKLQSDDKVGQKRKAG